MPRFSRKEQAICPSCGKWKTTDFTPEELKEREWECSDCANKRLTNPADLPENRGAKEVSKFDPEYEFLVKLVKVISQAAPEAIPEIKQLAQSKPFHTVTDVEYLTTQIWTLATEKYNIPREWLINKLPKNASLKKAYHAINDLTQFALDDKQIQQHFKNRGTTVEDVVRSLPNFSIKYTPKRMEQQDPSLKDKTRGFYDFQSGTLYINPRLSLDSKRLTIIHEIEHAIQDASGVLPVHTPEELYQVRQTPYQDRTFEWGARQQQFNALKARGLGLDEIKKVMIERAIGNGEHTELELDNIKNNVSNEVAQMEEIYNEMMPESIMASKKKADLKEYSNQATKAVNDYIISHPAIMERVIDASKEAGSEEPLEEELQILLQGIEDELNLDEDVYWNELAYAWFHTVARDEPKQLINVDKLPTLDKPKKIDQLLEQLSIETDSQKKEKIKQHIERIKRAKLLKADLWPSQEQAGDMLSHEWNSIAYNPEQEADTSVSGPRPDEVGKEAKSLNIDQIVQILNAKDTNKVVKIDTTNLSLQLSDGTEISFDDAAKKAMAMNKIATGEFTGAEFSTDDVGVNPLLDIGPWSSPEDYGAKPQKSPFPNTSWLPAEDENKDQQPASNVAASLHKQALAQQDVVDFYLMSLLPEEYLSKEVSPDHYDALAIFKTIIQSLRDEYIVRGMHELKDEARTTAWVKAIPDYEMPEQLKPYYTFHDEPFRGHSDPDDESDSESELPYSCNSCGVGLTEDGVYFFNDVMYCESCESGAVHNAIREDVAFCDTHKVFVTDKRELKDFLHGYKFDSWDNHQNDQCQVVRFDAGKAIWKEMQENAKKQLELFVRERKERKPKQENAVTENDLDVVCATCGQKGGVHPVTGECPNGAGMFKRPAKQLKLPESQASLKKQAEVGWWEAPKDFSKYTSLDFYNIFEYAPWKTHYGGPLWAEIAKTVYEMQKTTAWDKLVVLIDHFHDLGHNTGKLLDKFPEWHQWFKNLLDQKAQKNSIRYLMPKASGPVRNLVTEYLRVHGKPWREDEEESKPKSKSGWTIGDEVLVEGAAGGKERYTPAKIVSMVDEDFYSKPYEVNYPSNNITEWVSAESLKSPQFAASSLNRPFSKKALLNKKALWWSSGSGRIEFEMTPDQVASVSGQGQHDEDARLLVKELRPVLDKIDPKVLAAELKEYGAWDDAALADHEENLQRLVWIAGNDISEHEFEQENKEVDVDIQELPTLDKPKKIDELLEQLSIETDPQKKEKIKQHINRIKMASLYKKANPDSRYWIAPDGTEFNAGTHHGAWVMQHKDILKKYGINVTKNLYDMGAQMYATGWTRVSNEPAGSGFQIEVGDASKLPVYLDNFIAKSFSPGDTIVIGDNKKGSVEITDPFPTIQKAVNKFWGKRAASLKQADLSGQIVNAILEAIELSGGITYNLSKGNLSGTPNYAVSIFPEKEKIVDGPIDFDTLEGYLLANQDLLQDPNNSFGAWTNGNKVFLDTVVTIPDKEEALKLAKQHNQLAIWDLKNNQEISTGVVRAFSKKLLIKKAEEQILSQEAQNEIAAASSPAYVIAVNNYAEAVKRGHDKNRALAYAVESVENLEQINEKKLVEFINNYL